LDLFAFALIAAACGGSSTPSATPASPVRVAWTTTIDVAHPLVGKIWEPRAARFVAPEAVYAALAAADYAILGEKHDNPDHHALQARCLEAVVARGRRPSVAFEMIDSDQQPALDAFLAHGGGAAGLGAAVEWDKRGWPSYRTYAPIVEVALAHRLAITAANMPLSEVRAIVKGGLDPETARRLHLDAPLPQERAAELREEMRAAHCGQLPESMLEPMALAQRARDATMAERMRAQPPPVVLVAGDGHARTDRGVPAYLPRALSIAFLEVEAGVFEPKPAPYDYVWYTPRATDEDPCARPLRRASPRPEPAGTTPR
jgi:uncharacterized iron-regulated protein